MKNNQLKIGIYLSYVQTLITTISGILFTPIILRLFGQNEYGLYSLASSLLGYLFLMDFGFSNAIVKYISQYKARHDQESEQNISAMFLILYSIIGIMAFVLGIICSTKTEIIFGKALNSEEINRLSIMLVIMSINLGVSFPFRVFSGVITAYEKFIFPKIVNIITSIITPIATIITLSIGYRSIVLIVVTTVLNLIVCMLNVYYCFNKLHIRIRLIKFDFNLLREIINYSFYVFVASVVDIVYSQTDILILGSLIGTEEVSIYNVANTLNNMYTQYTMIISGFLLPKVVKLITTNDDNTLVTDLYIKVSRIQAIFVGLVLTGFWLVGEQFIVLWAGQEYYKSFDVAVLVMTVRAIPIIQVLAVSILQAKGLHKFRSNLYIIIAILNLIISIPLANQYGAVGCAIGTVIGITVNTVIMNIYYSKIGLQMTRYYKEIGKVLIPIIITFIIGIIIEPAFNIQSMLELLVFVGIYTAIYCISIYCIGLNEYERALIKEPVMKIKKMLVS